MTRRRLARLSIPLYGIGGVGASEGLTPSQLSIPLYGIG